MKIKRMISTKVNMAITSKEESLEVLFKEEHLVELVRYQLMFDFSFCGEYYSINVSYFNSTYI